MKIICAVRRTLCAAAAGSVLLLLAGCTQVPGDADFTAYQKPPLRAEVTGRTNGVTFGARIELSGLPEDGSPRDARIEYTAPETLCGVAAVRKNGSISVTYDGLELSGEPLSGLLRAADAFSLTADVVGASPEKAEDGTPVTVLEFSDGSVVRVDSTSGYPLIIETGDISLRTVRFEPDTR